MKTGNPARSKTKVAAAFLALALVLLAGCTAPIGARQSTPARTLQQLQGSTLNNRHPGRHALWILQRYDLERVFDKTPNLALQLLHQKALDTGDRDLLFALAELNHLFAERLRGNPVQREARDSRDYDLASACYAYLYLFGKSDTPPPDPFDDRFRQAGDLYNIGLGWALTKQNTDNSVAILASGTRRLPGGQIELDFNKSNFPWSMDEFDRFLLADHFVVRGLPVRNRQRGLGAPLIGVLKPQDAAEYSRALPVTVFLRLEGGLADLAPGPCHASLELYSGFSATNVQVEGRSVPLETDTTAPMAYALNQSRIWKLGRMSFLAPPERIPSQLILHQPFVPGAIPVVFVHGTFSSPVTWAEMCNSLLAEPELRQRYQIWNFIYGSGNPLLQSIADLRSALTAEVQKYDPHGTNAALHDMVIIGHSQGGLLTKSTAIDTGDRLWRMFSTNGLEDLKISDTQRANLRRYFFLKPLPFVRRVVFIATPHRGSYLSGSFVRGLARRFVSLPRTLVTRGTDLMQLTKGAQAEEFLEGTMPTSLDSMSPKNPGLLAMAEMPVKPPIMANSIIAVRGDGDYHQGRDGLVSYQSAHVDYAESEFIVRSFHTCLDEPTAIEEVRRILHEHLKEFPQGASLPASP
jgi:pimeloyl-ACP methyl ester carboxylesterase